MELVVFKMWGRQHESLNIPKQNLPTISDEQASQLIRPLVRYEIALGIRDALAEGLALNRAKTDRKLLINLTALEKKISYAVAESILKGDRSDFDEEEASDTPVWDQDIAIKFMQWISRSHPFLIATFLYFHSCDQMAAGLLDLDEKEQLRQIDDLYEWALEYRSY